jgi:5'-3' exonuclease
VNFVIKITIHRSSCVALFVIFGILPGRKIAIDASMCIYQFLIAVRSDGNNLTNEDGETTSHLMGMFYRTIRLMENGIKPVYVFDGKPPSLKGHELEKRQERRAEAQENLDKATELGNYLFSRKKSRPKKILRHPLIFR